MGALGNYFGILAGKSAPRFQRLREYPVAFDPSAGTGELWKLHHEAMGRLGPGKPPGEDAETSLLDLKSALAKRMLDACRLCQHGCGANRNAGERGRCKVLEARISSEFMHYGEEPELVPSYTIFFSGCTFECVYCQNYDISQYASVGEVFTPREVAGMIARRTEARNVNWVGGDPTSNLPFILEVLAHSDTMLPQVWNSNMYLSGEAMALLDGAIDVYLTDFKYGNDACAKRLSKADNYWEAITRNHRLAREQAEMIIRHLVLPDHVECCSKPVLDWIAENLEGVRVNVMAQYRPVYMASEYPEINRPLKSLEFLEAREHARALGLDLV